MCRGCKGSNTNLEERMVCMNKRGKLWTKPFILLILANWFTFMSFQMLIPTLPPHMQNIGGSELSVGLVTTLFSVAAVLIRPFIGFILESQPRKQLILFGSVSLLVVTILYPFLHIVALFLLLRFMHGLGWGLSTTVNGTAAVDLIPSSRIGEGMGYFTLSVTLGMIIAPSLGIYIFQHYHFNALIFISGTLGVIALALFSLIKIPQPDSVKKLKVSFKSFSFFGSLIDRQSWYPALVTFLTAFGYGSIVTFIVIFTQEKSLEHVFLFYLFNALTATLVRPITGKWFDRKGPWSLILTCALLAFAGMWALILAKSNAYLILSGILFGMGYGSMIPALQSWVLSKTTREKSGTANGMYYSAIDMGIGLSGLLLGIIKPAVGTAALFELSSICFIVVIVLVFVDYVRQSRNRPRTVKGKGIVESRQA